MSSIDGGLMRKGVEKMGSELSGIYLKIYKGAISRKVIEKKEGGLKQNASHGGDEVPLGGPAGPAKKRKKGGLAAQTAATSQGELERVIRQKINARQSAAISPAALGGVMSQKNCASSRAANFY